MLLKNYQSETLSVLRRFFEEARIAGPKNAYEAITGEPDQAKRLGRYGGTYEPLSGLPGVPYVCLRLPTGGGKTILGAHAIPIARDTWVEKDYPLVLWLVPSNTIRLQTAEALKKPSHPYRQVLDDAFDGRVRVFDIADFTHIRPHDIRDNLCVVVGTIQTLRVTNTEGRKVYAHNEEMEPHFTTISPSAPGLERSENGSNKGGIKFSFANLMHVHRPLMIVDEAHGAVTGLTRDMQTRVNPCAIIEFTATPKPKSNILHSVTAQELKKEEMIKLPIKLAEHDNWQGAVNGAIASRAMLAEVAKRDKDYIRPIVLFQAQPRNQEVTVEVLKKHLIETESIPEDKIAVATGEQRELDGLNLFDPKCPVEYVITVEALKEGWDCSFAYVFCSVARIKNADYVEQLLGRVLRMPYAKRRSAPELNRAYAHVSEPTFQAAALALVDKLIDMGFEEEEAKENIEPVQPRLDEDDLFSSRIKPKPTFRHTLPATPDVLSALATSKGEGVEHRDIGDGTVEIVVTGHVDANFEKSIAHALPEPARKGFSDAVQQFRYEARDMLSPAENGETFRVPRLVTEIQGELEFADVEVFMEYHDWSLLDHPWQPGEKEFQIRETARSFEIDLDGNHLSYQFSDEQEQLTLDVDVAGWTEENLVLWLDRQVRQMDVHQTILLRWLRDIVAYLTGPRGLHISALMRSKFVLARKLLDKIDTARRTEKAKVYQRYLFAPEALVEASFDSAFEFKDGMYWDERSHRYTGRFRFSKHFLGADNVPAFDGAENGEEFQCAQAIDSLPDVKYWIRNVARHRNSFWLPTATDRFYPDFVALLGDGRLFVVEYKGAMLADSADTDEKRLIGRLWETSCGGKGLFIVAEKDIGGRDVRAQLLDKISPR